MEKTKQTNPAVVLHLMPYNTLHKLIHTVSRHIQQYGRLFANWRVLFLNFLFSCCFCCDSSFCICKIQHIHSLTTDMLYTFRSNKLWQAQAQAQALYLIFHAIFIFFLFVFVYALFLPCFVSFRFFKVNDCKWLSACVLYLRD